MKAMLYTSLHEPQRLLLRYIHREYLNWELVSEASDCGEPIGLVLADLDLPDCMERVTALRKRNPDCQIIFISSTDAKAISCFRLHPAAYLLKPLRETDMIAALDWCVRWLGGYETLDVTVNRIRSHIRLKDIVFVESLGGDCLVHTKTQSQRFRASLSGLSKLHNAGGFLRCHNSFLVNLNHVEQVSERCFVMQDGSEIPLSPKREEDMAACFQSWRDQVLC